MDPLNPLFNWTAKPGEGTPRSFGSFACYGSCGSYESSATWLRKQPAAGAKRMVRVSVIYLMFLLGCERLERWGFSYHHSLPRFSLNRHQFCSEELFGFSSNCICSHMDSSKGPWPSCGCGAKTSLVETWASTSMESGRSCGPWIT